MFFSSKKPTHVALFDYEATKVDEIDVKKGELLKVQKTINNDWVLAYNETSNLRGNVPVNYIAKVETLDAEEYYFKDMSRREAIEMLQSPIGYQQGKFLVRTPETSTQHQFSLSFLKDDPKSGKLAVKHIRIHKNKRGQFYINKDNFFPSVQELIKHYQKSLLSSTTCPKPKPPVYQEWEINRKEIEKGRPLGVGNFGEVYYGVWRKKEVAIKTLKPGSMAPHKFMEEVTIMKNIRHKNLVALYGVCTEREPFMMIQEYVCSGSLLDCLRKSPRIYNFDDLILISGQVASGMAYLERKHLIHRDLAARNVLMDDKKIAKICDFGLAKFCPEDEGETTSVGPFPVRWTAPEAMTHMKYTIKSDVWSFGILLQEIYTYGEMPYQGLNNKQVRDKVVFQGYRMPKMSVKEFELPDNIYTIMLNCWDAKPEQRPTFERLRFFFEDYSIDSEKHYMKPEEISKKKCTIL